MDVLQPDGSQQNCLRFAADLDYNGAWVVTAGSGYDENPDYTYITDMTLMDASHVATAQQLADYHEQHKKQALKDMTKFNEEYHAKDLLHNDKSSFTKEQFGQDNLLAMLPEQLISVRKLMIKTQMEMYETMSYYSQVGDPLRGHKSQNERFA